MDSDRVGADTDPRLVRIAEAIVEGWSVDWAWEEQAYPEGREALGKLRLLQSVARASRSNDGDSVRQSDGLGRWGRLTIRAKLGEGVFGEVYRAYDSLLDREVALKLARAIDPSHTERFVSEARRLARVRHPNVLVVHGADVSEGRMGMWTDLLRGTTLAQYLASKGPLEPREAALIGVELCRALTAVHDEGIVHRDLKAANVMREPGGRVVLMDFGSGGELQADGVAPNGHVYGTPLLMAPEQIRGDAVGQQADTYSLGVLLYNAVTGEYPITGGSLTELIERHISGKRVLLQTRRPDLPSRFVQVIDRSVDPDPRHRFQTARDMEHDLLAYIESCSSAVDRTPHERETLRRVLSVAVLPFANRGPTPHDDYFSDGLADELLHVLAKIPGLRVAARTSSVPFKVKGIAEVGRALNVATVLQGSVRMAGNRVRISVQLAKTSDGFQLWSETYDRTLGDIFAVQDDIAQSVVKELRIALEGASWDSDATNQARMEVARAAEGRATDPEAHRLYLMARHFMDRGTHEGTTKAIEYLRLAVDLDPPFALAWAELSRAYAEEAHFGWIPGTIGSWKENGRKWFEEARRAAERALTLKPDLAEAHVRLGIIQLRYELDWRGAEFSLTRARETAPRDVPVLRGLGLVARSRGQVEKAVRLLREALEQDPLSPHTYQHLGICLECLDRLAEAETAFRKSVDLAPQKIITHALLSLTLADQGRIEEALAEARLEPDEVYRLWAMAIIDMSIEGHEATTSLQQLIDKYGDGATFQIAEAYNMRGETDAAFEWLERAYVQRDGGLLDLKVSPRLRSLHGDPRMTALIEKMGLKGPW
jgi:serine/threonine protein kinase/tetratricopeptide (TPR) repeat protein